MKTLTLVAFALSFSATVLAADSVAITGVGQRPWMIRDGGVLKSETELAIENGAVRAIDAWVKISVAGRPDCVEPLGNLPVGKSSKVVHVPELEKDGDAVTFAVFDNSRAAGTPLGQRTLAQQKIRRWRLYIQHNSHQDIGYTDYQEILRNEKWPSFWDQALLKDMPNSDTWPDDAKVRLEAEATYQLATTLPVRSADWFETLRARLAERRFAYGAALGDNAHSNYGAEELARSTYYADRFLKDRTGVGSTRNVIMRDEPVMSWGAIDALVDAGAKSFVLQHNYDHNLWRGTTSYPELFYAQGRNPASRLLVWNSLWAGYGVDELNLRGSNPEDVMARITKKLMGYQKTGGPGQDGQYTANRATDGVIGKTDQGEWASGGEQTPWIKLSWPTPHKVHKVCLYDRPNPSDDASGGQLEFSDGTVLQVTGIPANGTVKEVTFPERQITWMRFNATQGTGPNVGLSELEVYAGTSNIATGASAAASSAYDHDGGSHPYPYDVAMVNFTLGGDNNPMSPRVYENIKAISGRGYVYPRVICANYDMFFEDVAARWSASIPTFKGTIEDWWNFGAASTAYETGLNRMNHDTLAAAETLATFARVTLPEKPHPCELISSAYENLLLYDEHTWGSPTPAVDEQWRWKRNTAIASDLAATKVLNDSLAALNSRIPTRGRTIVVHNNLTWTRSDVVAVIPEGFPPHFDLIDEDRRKAVAYQKEPDGTVVFVAADVPGMGYKTFRVASRADDPVFPTSVKAAGDTLENKFFRITFNPAGAITSILDKQHGNAEMVDGSAPYPLNQYVLFKEGKLAGEVASANLTPRVASILGSMTAAGATTGLDSLSRRVILYDSLPRIDIVNDTVKGQQLANVEIGYFSFPLNVSNFMLRHEMPTGDMRPAVSPDVNDPAIEQYYSSSTAFYTVNRWVDASNQRDWGVTFASLTAPLVSYGKPDIGATKGGWKVNYTTSKPWIYSMAFNNEWQTNFQKTQPGRVIFRYSLFAHAGGSWQAGNAETFGAEVASPFKVAVIPDTQPGGGLPAGKGQFLGINRNNVVLTTAKLAEANGEGLILRFNEIKGKTTGVQVNLAWLAPASVVETDLIENDRVPLPLDGNTLSFTIPPFGFKTYRLLRGEAPPPVTGVEAAFDRNGCRVSWKDQPGAACFEVFRGTSPDFRPGTGSYVGTVSTGHYYDPTVMAGLTRTYYYAVRAVRAGRKGPFSPAVKAAPDLAPDTVPPSVPWVSGLALHPTKVTLSWEPAADNFAVKGYKVYRDDAQIADLPAVFNSWMDDKVLPGTRYSYTVKACDGAGNLSPSGKPAEVITGPKL